MKKMMMAEFQDGHHQKLPVLQNVEFLIFCCNSAIHKIAVVFVLKNFRRREKHCRFFQAVDYLFMLNMDFHYLALVNALTTTTQQNCYKLKI